MNSADQQAAEHTMSAAMALVQAMTPEAKAALLQRLLNETGAGAPSASTSAAGASSAALPSTPLKSTVNVLAQLDEGVLDGTGTSGSKPALQSGDSKDAAARNSSSLADAAQRSASAANVTVIVQAAPASKNKLPELDVTSAAGVQLWASAALEAARRLDPLGANDGAVWSALAESARTETAKQALNVRRSAKMRPGDAIEDLRRAYDRRTPQEDWPSYASGQRRTPSMTPQQWVGDLRVRLQSELRTAAGTGPSEADVGRVLVEAVTAAMKAELKVDGVKAAVAAAGVNLALPTAATAEALAVAWDAAVRNEKILLGAPSVPRAASALSAAAAAGGVAQQRPRWRGQSGWRGGSGKRGGFGRRGGYAGSTCYCCGGAGHEWAQCTTHIQSKCQKKHGAGSARGRGRGPTGAPAAAATASEPADDDRVEQAGDDRDNEGEDLQYPTPPSNPVVYSAAIARASVDGLVTAALVDTGAAVTMLRFDLAQKIMATHRKLRPWRGPRIVAADGHRVEVLGLLPVNVELARRALSIDALVVHNAPAALIIGVDYLHTARVSIDFAAGKVTVDGRWTPLRIKEPVERPASAFVAATVTVPPRSCVAVELCVDKEALEGTDVLFEEGSRHEIVVGDAVERLLHPLVVPRAVLVVHHGRVILNAHNHTSREVTLVKGTLAGALTVLRDGSAVVATLAAQDGSPQAASEPTQSNSPGSGNAGSRRRVDQILEACDTSLSSSERQQLRRLLEQYQELFVDRLDVGGRARGPPHVINTGDAAPVHAPLRHYSPAERAEITRQVDELKRQGVIRDSVSPWAAPIVLVKKKDGTKRLCVDYRKLNAVTVKDAFPLPRIDSTLDSLKGAKYFTVLDLCSGYYQLPMNEDSAAKTAFRVPDGLYEFMGMPMGIANAPGSFQRFIAVTLSGLVGLCALAYIDDVIVYSSSFEAHIIDVGRVLAALKSVNLRIKASKVKLAMREVLYLGHYVSGNGIRTDPDKVRVVAEAKPPKNAEGLLRFLGLCSYYRRFVARYAAIADPLHALTKKGVPWTWTVEHDALFNALKVALTTAPVLAHPDPRKPYYVTTDASQSHVGAVLAQDDEAGNRRPVAFFSAALEARERNWTALERELFAVVRALRKWRPYLLGAEVVVLTDHEPLKYCRTARDPTHKFARWAAELEEFSPTIKYIRGKSNIADALTREPLAAGHATETGVLPAAAAGSVDGSMSTSVLVEHQRRDGALLPIILALEKNDVAALAQFKNSFGLRHGVLVRICRVRNGEPTIQTVVPASLVPAVLHENHDSSLAAHRGVNGTLKRIMLGYWWPSIIDDVHGYVESCDVCQRTKPISNGALGGESPADWKPPTGPWQRVGLDLVTSLGVSRSGNKCMLTVIDHFTKWVEAFALPNEKSDTVARVYLHEVVKRFGAPVEVITDNGGAFVAQTFEEMNRLAGTRVKHTTAYHPATNGTTERANGTLVAMLRAMAHQSPEDWDQYLPMAVSAYLATPHASTGFSPAFMMFGRELRSPLDIAWRAKMDVPPSEPTAFVRDAIERSTAAQAVVRARLEQAQQAAYEARRRASKPDSFDVGDSVLRRADALSDDVPRKLHPLWLGPFIVVERPTPTTYTIRHRENAGRVETVNVERLRRCKLPDGYNASTSDDEIFEVDYIRAHAVDRVRGAVYLVRWAGFTKRHDTWERAANVEATAADEVARYWRSKPSSERMAFRSAKPEAPAQTQQVQSEPKPPAVNGDNDNTSSGGQALEPKPQRDAVTSKRRAAAKQPAVAAKQGVLTRTGRLSRAPKKFGG